MQQEEAVPWDPIPHEFNRLSDLDVSDLRELRWPPEDGVSIIVSSPPLESLNEEHQWRLVFRVAAYMSHGYDTWAGALPLTWPAQRWAVDGWQVAMWEVANSLLIRQTVDYIQRDRFHHYVVMAHDIAYEFVASEYRVEDLGIAP